MKKQPYTRERGGEQENYSSEKLFKHVMQLVSDRIEMPFALCEGSSYRYCVSAKSKGQVLEEQTMTHNPISWHIEIEYFERHKMAQIWFINLTTTETHMAEIPFKVLSEFPGNIMNAIKLWKEGKIKDIAKVSGFGVELPG